MFERVYSGLGVSVFFELSGSLDSSGFARLLTVVHSNLHGGRLDPATDLLPRPSPQRDIARVREGVRHHGLQQRQRRRPAHLAATLHASTTSRGIRLWLNGSRRTRKSAAVPTSAASSRCRYALSSMPSRSCLSRTDAIGINVSPPTLSDSRRSRKGSERSRKGSGRQRKVKERQRNVKEIQ